MFQLSSYCLCTASSSVVPTRVASDRVGPSPRESLAVAGLDALDCGTSVNLGVPFQLTLHGFHHSVIPNIHHQWRMREWMSEGRFVGSCLLFQFSLKRKTN